MSGLEAEFPTALRGYERGVVDDAIRDLRKEILSLSARNSQLANELKTASESLEKLNRKLEEVGEPSYAGVGAKAALILSTAEDISKQLASQVETEREKLLAETNAEIEELHGEAKGYYDSLVAEAQRRSERMLAQGRADAEDLLSVARSEAVRIVEEATREAGSIRGATATEVARLRATAKREAESLRAKVEREQAERKLIALRDNTAKLDMQRAEELVSERARIDLELELTARRAEAEAEYLQKHQEAVAATQKYLDDANTQLSTALTRLNAARLEAETLEAAARSMNKAVLDKSREKAEATIAAAETEARGILADAEHKAAQTLKAMRKQVIKLEKERDSVAIYINNLVDVVARVSKDIQS